MELNYYVYFDRVAGLFATPFLSNNHETAKRTFRELGYKSDASQTYLDLDLYFIGTYNTVTGVINGVDQPEFITNGGLMLNEK